MSDASRRERIQLLSGGVVVCLLAVGLYGATLRFPLIYDSLLHIRITKELTWLNVWVPTDSFGFYRPFTFVPLLIVKGVLGTYPAWLLHGINVLTHGVNGILLLWLSWRLWGRPVLATFSAVLFILFPFSYQAVSVYGHNVHLAITNLILIGLLLYLAALTDWRGRRRLWWTLVALVALKALLTHESAILFGVFAGLVHVQVIGTGALGADIRQQLSYLSEASLRFVRANLPWIILLAGGLLYLFAYQFFPLSRAPQGATSIGGSLGFKMMYVGQGISHPLASAFFATGLFGPILMVVVGFLLVLGSSLLAGRWSENRWPLFTGWVWFMSAAMLVALPLPTGYLLNGPRLLYLGSVGVAIVWPWMLAPLCRLYRPFGSLFWLALLLAIGLGNGIFVRERLDAYDHLTSPVRLVDEVLVEAEPDRGVMLINLPSWVAPLEKWYPAGAEFVVMMGPYLFAEELVEANIGGENRPVWAGAVRDIQRDPDYGYTVHTQSQLDGLEMDWAPAGSDIIISYYEDEGVVPRHTGSYESVMGATTAAIGPYTLGPVTAERCGDTITVHSQWQPQEVVPPTTSLFVQLLGADGGLIAQADGPPAGLRPDLVRPVTGWAIADQRQLSWAAGEPTAVLLGVYDFTTGTRFSVIDSQGNILADSAIKMAVADCDLE